MNIKNMLVAAGFLVSVVHCGYAEENHEGASDGVQKVMLKISTVETVGTRTQKTWNPPVKPMVLTELPHTEEDIAKASPLEARDMARENRAQRISNQKIQAAIALDAYVKATEHFEGVKKQLEGTTFGRQIILAVDKFAGYAGEIFDSDCIEFFHRMDNDEGDKEQFIKDMGATDTISAPYFIKLVFDDPRVESGKVEMNGQEIKRTKITVGVTFQVQNLSGKMITSGVVKQAKTSKSTSAVVRSGADNGMLTDTIEDALKEVAKRINNYFVAKSTIKLIGPKNDSDFDPDAATIEIDGSQQDADTEFSIMKGKHTIVVDLDGFKQTGKTTFDIKKSGTIKIKMQKVVEKKSKSQDADDE